MKHPQILMAAVFWLAGTPAFAQESQVATAGGETGSGMATESVELAAEATEDTAMADTAMKAGEAVTEAPATEVAEAPTPVASTGGSDLFTDNGETGLDAIEGRATASEPAEEQGVGAKVAGAVVDYAAACTAKIAAYKVCSRIGGLKSLACRAAAAAKYREYHCPGD